MSELMTIEQALSYHLPIGRTKLFELIKSGELKTVRIGRRRLIRSSDIDAFIEGLT